MEKLTLAQGKFGIGFLVGSAVWVFILRCVYEATPFLQWLDEKYPVLSISLFGVAFLSPLGIGCTVKIVNAFARTLVLVALSVWCVWDGFHARGGIVLILAVAEMWFALAVIAYRKISSKLNRRHERQ